MKNKGIRLFINIGLIAIAGSTILGYAYFRARAYLEGPSITITTPGNSVTVTDPYLTVSGDTERVSAISLDGRKIFIDKEGVFNEKVLLYPGYNVIQVEATDRFEKKVTRRLEIIYKEAT